MPQVPYWRLSAYYFTYFAFVGVFSPYFGLYLQSLSFSAWEIGLLMSQMQLMRLFGPYLWGVLADRSGQRLRIVRLTSLATLLAFSAIFFLSSFAALMLAIAAVALFWTAALPLIETLTFDHLREDTARYSRIRLWGSVGFIFAVMLAGVALDHLPLISMIWLSVAMLLTIVFSSWQLPEAPVAHLPEEPAPLGEILRQPRVFALLAASFTMAAAHAALNIFYTIFLADHGYSKATVGSLFSLGVVAEIAVFFLMSQAMRRYSLRTILIVSFGASVLRFATIGWGVDFLGVLVLTQVMHGLTFGAFHAAAISAINRWFPGATRARGQALYSSLAFGGGGLLGGVISGWTWDHFGGQLTFALGSMYALIGLVLVLVWVRDDAVGEQNGGCAVDASDTL